MSRRPEEGKEPMLRLSRRAQIFLEIWRHPGNRGRRGRALARAVLFEVSKRLGGRSWTIALPAGGRLLVPAWSGSGTKFLRASGRADWDELLFCERYLRPGDRCVDAGANIGAYTIVLGSLVGSTGAVHAFEPVPRLAEILRRNVGLNRLECVRVHAEALSDDAGQVSIVDRDTASAVVASGGMSVPARRLDELAELRMVDVALMKLDVEGHEAPVLRGARDLLERRAIAVVLFEVGSGAEANRATYRELSQAGFRFARFEADRGTIREVVPPAVRPAVGAHRGYNLWAIHDSAWSGAQVRVQERTPRRSEATSSNTVTKRFTNSLRSYCRTSW
jgi:FkbM family methyltransferase